MPEETVVQNPDSTEQQVNAEELAAKEASDPQATPEQGDKEQGQKSGWQRSKEARKRAEEERDYWRNEALKNARKPEPEAKVEIKPEPSWGEYEAAGKSEQFFKDLAKWTAAEQLNAYKAEQAAEAKKRETQAEQEKQAAKWAKEADEFRKEHSDFDEVIAQGNPSDLLSNLVARSKEPAKLAYHLANNPELESRLSRINDPVEVAQELGEIRAQLAKPEPAAEEKEIPPIPTAPPPITPVRKVTPGTDKGLSDELARTNPKEWDKRYLALMEKRKK